MCIKLYIYNSIYIHLLYAKKCLEDIFSHFSKQQQAFWKTCVNCEPTSLAISFLRAYLIGTPYIYLIYIYKYIWRLAHVVVSNATLWQTIIEHILKTDSNGSSFVCMLPFSANSIGYTATKSRFINYYEC